MPRPSTCSRSSRSALPSGPCRPSRWPSSPSSPTTSCSPNRACLAGRRRSPRMARPAALPVRRDRDRAAGGVQHAARRGGRSTGGTRRTASSRSAASLATATSTEAAAIEIAERLTSRCRPAPRLDRRQTGGRRTGIADTGDGPAAAHAPASGHARSHARTTSRPAGSAPTARSVRGSRRRTATPTSSSSGLEVDGIELGTLFGIPRPRARRPDQGGDPDPRARCRPARPRIAARPAPPSRDRVEVARQTRRAQDARSSIRCRMTCARRSPASARPPGSLADADVEWHRCARRDAATLIDAEAARLDRLVSGVLDLSRIASGALHPDLEPHELWADRRARVDGCDRLSVRDRSRWTSRTTLRPGARRRRAARHRRHQPARQRRRPYAGPPPPSGSVPSLER